MKILITGANGYIGSYIKKSLESNKIRYIESSRQSFDYLDINNIRTFFYEKNITHIIHLAGSVSNTDSEELFNINLLGLYNLLKVSAENNVRHFTFVSGNNVYGAEQNFAYNENHHPEPSSENIYGFSKYLGELLVKDFCCNQKLIYANVRVADVYGPEQKHGNLLKAIVGNIRDNKELFLYGKGNRERDYIYVKDVADGLVYISKNNLSGVYNLSTGKGTTVKQLLDIVNVIMENNINIKKVDVQTEDTSSVVLEPDKLIREGFCAKYTVEDGLREILKGEINE